MKMTTAEIDEVLSRLLARGYIVEEGGVYSRTKSGRAALWRHRMKRAAVIIGIAVILSALSLLLLFLPRTT